MNQKPAAVLTELARIETRIVPIVSSSPLVCTIDMTMETEPEASSPSIIVDHSSPVITENSSIELSGAYVPFLQDSSVRHASRHSPITVDSTVGHASRHSPIRVEIPTSHASQQLSASLVSGVTHVPQEPYIAPIDNISSTPPPTFASRHEQKQQRQKANLKRKNKIMKKMKAYHEYLKKTGWLENDDNLRQNIPPSHLIQ